MIAILCWLLQNSLSIACLVALVAGACRLCRHRPALQHALWLVVLLKFLMPPLVHWPWSVTAPLIASTPHPSNGSTVNSNRSASVGSDWSDLPGGSETQDLLIPPQLLMPRPASESRAEFLRRFSATQDSADGDQPVGFEQGDGLQSVELIAPGSQIVSRPESYGVASSVASAIAGTNHVLWSGLFALWAIGCCAIAIGQLHQIMRHWQLLRYAQGAPDHLRDAVHRASEAMHIAPIPVRVLSGLVAPLVWCVGRPLLLWPERLSGVADVRRCRGVIAHELAHVRRRDHWVAWLELVVRILYWWNPLFWVVRRRIHDTAELACDALALGVLPDGRREYAEAFLELSSIRPAAIPVPVLGVSTGGTRSFERRFVMILSDKVSGSISVLGIIAVAAIALVALPSWSLSQTASVSPVKIDTRAGQSLALDASATVLNTDNAATGQSSSIAVQLVAPDGTAFYVIREGDTLASIAKAHYGSARFWTQLYEENQDILNDPIRIPVGTTLRLSRLSEPVSSIQNQPAQSSTAPIESRVQKLEEKLEAILQELRSSRGKPSPGGGAGASGPQQQTRETKVFRLQHAVAPQLTSSLRGSDLPDVTIAADERTNSVLVSSTPDTMKLVTDLVQQLDVPVDSAPGAAPPGGAGESVRGSPQHTTSTLSALTDRFGSGKAPAQRALADTQLDLVSLGTASIDAYGALRLAQARLDRIKGLGASISNEEALAAEINFDTARRKMNLLTAIVRSAINTAKVELEAAEVSLVYLQHLHKANAVPPSQVDEAQSRVAAAQGKLELLTFILASQVPSEDGKPGGKSDSTGGIKK